MKKLLIASVVLVMAGPATARTIYYPAEACQEILSSEYSTGGADTSWSQFEILCRDAEGRYRAFVTSWATAGGFLGFGRVTHETHIDLVPYDGDRLRAD